MHDLLFVWAVWGSRSTNATVSDSLNNTWATAYASSQTDGDFFQAWYASADATGTDSVTIAYSNNANTNYGIWGIEEFHGSGLTALSPFDQSGFGSGSGSAMAATTSAAVSGADDLVIGFGGTMSANGTYTAGGGATIPVNGQISGSGWSAAMEWREDPAPSGVEAASMSTTASSWGFGVVAFKTDNVPPTTSITSPGNGATVSGTVTVAASATDNVAVKNVQFQVDGTDVGAPITAAPYNISWVTGTVTNGSHTITAIATDTSGNQASSSVAVTLENPADTTPPTVSIASPTASSTVSAITTLTALASDNVAVASVTFEDNGNLIGTVTSSPYSVAWNTYDAYDGPHVITAVAEDYAGNTSTATTTLIVQDTTALPAGQKWVSAYYESWYQTLLTPSNIDYSAVTDIMHFNINPNATGSLDLFNNFTDPAQSSQAVIAAHEAGKKILITVGGAFDGSLYDSAMSPTYRTTFINNIVNFVTSRGYDGVDLDIEPISTSDNYFDEFVPLLSAALRAVNPDALLTIAVQVGNTVPVGPVESYFNQVNLMTYDMSGAYSGWVTWFNSPLYSGGATFPSTGGKVPSINQYVEQAISDGVPASKLGIGVEFYGTVWRGGTGAPTGNGGVDGPLQSWTTAPSLSPDQLDSTLIQTYPTSSLIWDASSSESYASVYDAASSSLDAFVSYDDNEAIAAKANYVTSNNLGGIIVYALAGGYVSSGTTPAAQEPFLEAVKSDLILSTTTASTTIQSVGGESAITVSKGTSFSSLSLPTTVLVTLSTGAQTSVGISWSQGSYDGNTAGTYTLTGALTSLPTSVTNPADLTASINVTVSSATIYAITAITSPKAINVSYGTGFASLSLPGTVVITLSNDATDTASVSWAEGSYDGNTAGTYTLTGALTSIPADAANSLNLLGTIDVTVGNAPSSGGGGGGGGGWWSSGSVTDENAGRTISPAKSSSGVAGGLLTTILGYNERGSEVQDLQSFLASQGLISPKFETGFFGPLTFAAVRKFQCDEHIVCSGTADTTGWGHVGPETLQKIDALERAVSSSTAPVAPPTAVQTSRPAAAAVIPDIGAITHFLARTERGNQVKDLQAFLAGQGLFPDDLETGYFGPVTLEAVQTFQCLEHIVCSGGPGTTGWGHVGPETLQKIGEIANVPVAKAG